MKLFATLAIASMIAAPAFAQEHGAEATAPATTEAAPAADASHTTETKTVEKHAGKHGKHMKKTSKKEKTEGAAASDDSKM